MQRIKLTLLALALGLAVTPVKAQVGNDWLNALSSTNLTIGTHALFDLTTKTAGGGIFAVYDLNNYVGGLVTLDYLNHNVYSVRGNVQLQLPIPLKNLGITLAPYSFAGVGTALGGKGGANGDPIGIVAIGAAVSWKSWAAGASYQRWTGGGFNDNIASLFLAYRITF
jgi:hypothetical protein